MRRPLYVFSTIFLLPALLIVTTGCGQSVSGTSAYVTVGNVWNDADGLAEATKWCAQHGKVPRYRFMERYRATYDCVSGS